MRVFRILALALVLASPAASAAPFKTLYEVLAERGEYDAKADTFKETRKAAPELERIAWIIGDWRQVASVFPNGRVRGSKTEAGVWRLSIDRSANSVRWAPRDAPTEQIPFMTYDPYSGVWFGAESATDTWGVTRSSTNWTESKIVVEGHMTIRGVECDLRQTMERVKPGEFVVFNEQKRPDGSWIPIDEHRFFRAAASRAAN